MKVVVIVRTRNEERNIERFCSDYEWADCILVADGSSTDRTVELTWQFPRVFVRDFPTAIPLKKGLNRNPHGEHLNFLIDWATRLGADWIIHDDADCFPNYLVKETILSLMKSTNKNYIYITRLYLYKDQGHFPKLAQPIKTGVYEPGLWAWRATTGLRFKEGIEPHRHQELAFLPPQNEILKLPPPYCLLHCPWQDDEMINRKLEFYRKSGEVPNMRHPFESSGKLEPLPSWARP